MTNRELALACARAAIEKQANHSLIFEVGKLGAFTDYFLITSGSSDRQVQAISDNVHEAAKTLGLTPRMEGYDGGRWVLIDLGGVIVHIFLDAIREFYDLESLWSGAPRLGIPEEYFRGPATGSASNSHHA